MHYFTMVEEQWKAATSWPPPEAEPHRYYFADGGTLSRQIPDPASASNTYRANFAIGIGTQTFYEPAATIVVEAYYADWHGRDSGMLTCTPAPLSGDTEVTGHPIITLYMASSEKDGAFCV